MVFSKIKQALPKNDQTKHLVALDIGTEYVKALIARVGVDEEGQPNAEVIGVGRKHQGLSDMHTGAIADISGVVDNCDEALKQAEEMAGVQAKDVIIGIAGELVRGDTVTIKYRRPDSDKAIDQKEMEDIIAKVQQRALERVKAELARDSGGDIEVKLVNAALVNIHIDGYKVNNPIGFQGRDVAVQLFTAYAPMVHLGAIERVAYELDLQLKAVAAEPYAVASSVGVGINQNFNAVFIDVGGGTSDIAIVNEGGVEGTKMFGIGGRTFTQAIARSLGVSFTEAEKLKLTFSDGSIDKEKVGPVKDALMPVVKVWLSGVELALSEFEQIDQLPSKILLCGGGTGLPFITKALETTKWRAQLPFARTVQIDHIEPNQVQAVTDTTGKADDFTYITPLGLLKVGLDTLDSGDLGTGERLLRRFNEALQA